MVTWTDLRCAEGGGATPVRVFSHSAYTPQSPLFPLPPPPSQPLASASAQQLPTWSNDCWYSHAPASNLLGFPATPPAQSLFYSPIDNTVWGAPTAEVMPVELFASQASLSVSASVAGGGGGGSGRSNAPLAPAPPPGAGETAAGQMGLFGVTQTASPAWPGAAPTTARCVAPSPDCASAPASQPDLSRSDRGPCTHTARETVGKAALQPQPPPVPRRAEPPASRGAPRDLPSPSSPRAGGGEVDEEGAGRQSSAMALVPTPEEPRREVAAPPPAAPPQSEPTVPLDVQAPARTSARATSPSRMLNGGVRALMAVNELNASKTVSPSRRHLLSSEIDFFSESAAAPASVFAGLTGSAEEQVVAAVALTVRYMERFCRSIWRHYKQLGLQGAELQGRCVLGYVERIGFEQLCLACNKVTGKTSTLVGLSRPVSFRTHIFAARCDEAAREKAAAAQRDEEQGTAEPVDLLAMDGDRVSDFVRETIHGAAGALEGVAGLDSARHISKEEAQEVISKVQTATLTGPAAIGVELKPYGSQRDGARDRPVVLEERNLPQDILPDGVVIEVEVRRAAFAGFDPAKLTVANDVVAYAGAFSVQIGYSLGPAPRFLFYEHFTGTVVVDAAVKGFSHRLIVDAFEEDSSDEEEKGAGEEAKAAPFHALVTAVQQMRRRKVSAAEPAGKSRGWATLRRALKSERLLNS